MYSSVEVIMRYSMELVFSIKNYCKYKINLAKLCKFCYYVLDIMILAVPGYI